MKNKTVSRMMAIALSLAVAFSQPMLVNAENNPTPEQIEAAKKDVVNQANSISNSSENIGEDIEAIDNAFNPSFDEDIDGKINEAYKGNTTENVTGLNDASANVSTNLTGTNGAVAELNNATAAKSELEQIEKTVSGAIESANSAIGTANTSTVSANEKLEGYLNDINGATTADEANTIYQKALAEYEAANRDYVAAEGQVAAAERALDDAKAEIASQEQELGRASESSKQKLEDASINLEAAKKAAETLQKEAQNAMDKAEQALNGAQVALDNMGPLVDGALAIIDADKVYKNENGNSERKRDAGANVLLEMAKYYYSVKKPDALSLKESDKVTYKKDKPEGTKVTVYVCVNGVIEKTLEGEIQRGNNKVDNRTTDEFYLTIDGKKYTETTFRKNIGFDPNEAQNYETKKKEAEANLAAAKAAKESVDAKYGALKSDSAFKSEPTADKSYIEKAMEDVETLKSAVPTAPNSSLNDTLPSMLNTSTFDAITNLMNTLMSTLGEIEKKKDDLNKPDPDPNGGNGGNGNGNGGNGNGGNGGNGNGGNGGNGNGGNGNGGNGNGGNGGNGNGGNGGNGNGGNGTGGNGTGGNSGNNDDGTGNGGNNAGGNGITPLGNPAPANNGAAVMNAVANTGRNNNFVADAPAQEVEEAVADAEEEIVVADAEDIVVAEQVDETKQEGLTTQIEDNKTPLADAAPLSEEEKASMPWIWVVIVAALGAVGIVMYRQFAKKAKQVK